MSPDTDVLAERISLMGERLARVETRIQSIEAKQDSFSARIARLEQEVRQVHELASDGVETAHEVSRALVTREERSVEESRALTRDRKDDRRWRVTVSLALAAAILSPVVTAILAGAFGT